jgi:hypothetical protein
VKFQKNIQIFKFYFMHRQRYCDKLGEQVLLDDFDAFVPVFSPPFSSDSVYQHVLAFASIQLRCTTHSITPKP